MANRKLSTTLALLWAVDEIAGALCSFWWKNCGNEDASWIVARDKADYLCFEDATQYCKLEYSLDSSAMADVKLNDSPGTRVLDEQQVRSGRSLHIDRKGELLAHFKAGLGPAKRRVGET